MQPCVDVTIPTGLVCGETQLRNQQRLNRTTVIQHQLVLVQEGVLSLEAKVGKEQYQILDFFLPGNILSLSWLLAQPKTSIRAITKAGLVLFADTTDVQSLWYPELRELVVTHQQAHLSRTYVHQLMLGRLEAKQRIVSFLLTLAMRSSTLRSNLILDVAMSREDIADYLAMNRDSLSRIMMWLETSGLVERMNRHMFRIADLDELAQRTSIADQISAACILDKFSSAAVCTAAVAAAA
jgi:CRP/FNR family transcriptional regulator, anaerobic regulatory protein